MSTVVGWILAHKVLVFLITATTAFGISTIALGVTNTNLASDLDACRDEISTTTSTSVSSSVTPSASTEQSSTTEPTTEAPQEEDMSKYRLSGKVIPVSYDLYIYPDLEAVNFTGKVNIVVNVTEEVDVISLHSNKLTISSVSIDDVEGSFETDDTYELLNIYASNKSRIGVGSKTVTIDFSATMKDKIVGLYHSTYTNEDGEQR